MTRFFAMCIGAVLLSMVFTIGIACAADEQGLLTDLNVTKVVTSTGPYEVDDTVTWVVTLWNNGPGNATNISVTEDLFGLTGLHALSASPSLGDYNTTTNTWNITGLQNATYANLTLTTSFSTPGSKINNATITAHDQTDPDESDNSADATVQIKEQEIIPPAGPKADLIISKTVSSGGPYNLQDNVTWVVTLQNNGPDNATNITVTEDLSDLTGLHTITASPSLGTYNITTNTWNITELNNATSATLTLTTNFSTAGKKINRVAITALDETDPHPDDPSASATVQYNTTEITPPDAPVSAKLVIKPTTLNINSKGVFTVYVTIAGIAEKSTADQRNKPRFDENNSSLTCGEAEMIGASVSNKDGGTLIAKFHRYDLENVTTGNGVKINCSGTLVVNGMPVTIEGSDTIRVIGEKKGLDKILSGLWKLLGVEKDDISINESENGNITVTLSLNPDNFRNPGLAKKLLKYDDNESAADNNNETRMSVNAREEKEKPSKNTVNTRKINKNNGNNNQNDNSDKNQQNDESRGKSNGKKN